MIKKIVMIFWKEEILVKQLTKSYFLRIRWLSEAQVLYLMYKRTQRKGSRVPICMEFAQG